MPHSAQVVDGVGEVDRTGLLATLVELVEIPSLGGSPGEVAIQHRLAALLSGLGLEVDLWPLDLPALRQHPGHPGEEVARTAAYGLVASSGTEPGLILQAHVDVVPVGDSSAWSGDPFVARLVGVGGSDGPAAGADGRRLVGRGACDMKGGLAAVLGAVAAVQPAARNGAVVPAYAVHCVIGEEDGGVGAFATLARGHRGSMCVIPEPTGLDLVVGNAGALTFRLEVPGRPTHGSTAYEGVSAIDAYWPIHAALQRFAARRNTHPDPLLAHLEVGCPLSIGLLRAGDWSSTVPDSLVAEGRYGIGIGEDPADARAAFEAVVADVAAQHPFLRDHPPRVSWPGGQFAGGRLPEGHPLAAAVAAQHRAVTGRPIGAVRGAPYGSDLRLYAAAGIPTLHYGPGDIREAHAVDESVPLAEVVTTARVFTRLLLDPPVG